MPDNTLIPGKKTINYDINTLDSKFKPRINPRVDLETSTTTRGINYNEDYQDYFNPNLSLSDVQSTGEIDELRAQSQSGGEQLLNGTAKGVGLAATTFASNFTSLPYGLAKAAVTGNVDEIYNNEISRFYDGLNSKLEEVLPNYYTREEREADAFSWANIANANFIGDKLIKNVGFTAGTIGAMAVPGIGLSKTFGNLGKILAAGKLEKEGEAVAKLTAEYVSSGLDDVTALNKAINEVGSTIKMVDFGQKLAATTYSAAAEGSVEALQAKQQVYNNLKQNYTNQKLNEYLRVTGRTYDSLSENELYRIQNMPIDPKKEQEFNDIASSTGNAVLGFNTVILGGSDFIQFGKAIKGIKDEVKKDVGQVVSSKILKEEGKYKTVDKVGLLDYIKPVKSTITETAEEGLQYTTQIGVSDYQQKKYDNEGNATLSEAWNSTMKGLEETFTSKEGQESMLLGGLTGTLSGPIIGKMSGQGFTQDLNEAKERVKNSETVTNTLNQYTKDSPKFQEAVRSLTLAKELEESSKNGDTFNAKNAKNDLIKSMVTAYNNAGKMDDLAEQISDLENYTEEDFKKIIGVEENTPLTKNKEDYINKIKSKITDTQETLNDVNNRFIGFPQEIKEEAFNALTNIKDRVARSEEIQNTLQKEVGYNFKDEVNNVLRSENEEEYSNSIDNINNKIKEQINKVIGIGKTEPSNIGMLVQDLIKIENDRIRNAEIYKHISSEGFMKNLEKQAKEIAKSKKIKDTKDTLANTVNETKPDVPVEPQVADTATTEQSDTSKTITFKSGNKTITINGKITGTTEDKQTGVKSHKIIGDNGKTYSVPIDSVKDIKEVKQKPKAKDDISSSNLNIPEDVETMSRDDFEELTQSTPEQKPKVTPPSGEKNYAYFEQLSIQEIGKEIQSGKLTDKEYLYAIDTLNKKRTASQVTQAETILEVTNNEVETNNESIENNADELEEEAIYENEKRLNANAINRLDRDYEWFKGTKVSSTNEPLNTDYLIANSNLIQAGTKLFVKVESSEEIEQTQYEYTNGRVTPKYIESGIEKKKVKVKDLYQDVDRIPLSIWTEDINGKRYKIGYIADSDWISAVDDTGMALNLAETEINIHEDQIKKIKNIRKELHELLVNQKLTEIPITVSSKSAGTPNYEVDYNTNRKNKSYRPARSIQQALPNLLKNSFLSKTSPVVVYVNGGFYYKSGETINSENLHVSKALEKFLEDKNGISFILIPSAKTNVFIPVPAWQDNISKNDADFIVKNIKEILTLKTGRNKEIRNTLKNFVYLSSKEEFVAKTIKNKQASMYFDVQSSKLSYKYVENGKLIQGNIDFNNNPNLTNLPKVLQKMRFAVDISQMQNLVDTIDTNGKPISKFYIEHLMDRLKTPLLEWKDSTGNPIYVSQSVVEYDLSKADKIELETKEETKTVIVSEPITEEQTAEKVEEKQITVKISTKTKIGKSAKTKLNVEYEYSEYLDKVKNPISEKEWDKLSNVEKEKHIKCGY